MLILECIYSILAKTYCAEGGEVVKQFQIELEKVACQWLTHIAEVTDQSIENVIAGLIYEQVEILECSINKAFICQE